MKKKNNNKKIINNKNKQSNKIEKVENTYNNNNNHNINKNNNKININNNNIDSDNDDDDNDDENDGFYEKLRNFLNKFDKNIHSSGEAGEDTENGNENNLENNITNLVEVESLEECSFDVIESINGDEGEGEGEVIDIPDTEMYSNFKKGLIKRNQYNSKGNLTFHCFLKHENLEDLVFNDHKCVTKAVKVLCGSIPKKTCSPNSIINFQNHEGETPVHILVKNDYPNKNISLMVLIVLMTYGPNLKLLDKHGKDVFDYALEKIEKDYLEVFIAHGVHKPFEHLIPNSQRYQSYCNLSLRIKQIKKILKDNGLYKLSEIFMISEIMNFGSLSRAKEILARVYWDDEVCSFLLPPIPLDQPPTKLIDLPSYMILNSKINIVPEEELQNVLPVHMGFYLGVPVALKALTPGDLKSDPWLNKELNYQVKYGGHHENNIVKFYGTLDSNYMVVELCKFSLHFFLSRLELKTFLKWNLIIKFFRQMLTSIDYIHCKGIVHGDLNSDSFLISLENDLKLSNFGYKRGGPETIKTATLSINGQTKDFQIKKITTIVHKTVNDDIVSLGCIFWEFIANSLNTSDYSHALDKSKKGIKNLNNGRCLPIPFNCPYLVKKLILKLFKKQSTIPHPTSFVDESSKQQQPQNSTLKKALKLLDLIEKEYQSDIDIWDGLISSDDRFDIDIFESSNKSFVPVSNGTLVYFLTNQNIYNDAKVIKNVNDFDLSLLKSPKNNNSSKTSTTSTSSKSSSTTTVRTFLTKVTKKQFENVLFSLNK